MGLISRGRLLNLYLLKGSNRTAGRVLKLLSEERSVSDCRVKLGCSSLVVFSPFKLRFVLIFHLLDKLLLLLHNIRKLQLQLFRKTTVVGCGCKTLIIHLVVGYAKDVTSFFKLRFYL